MTTYEWEPMRVPRRASPMVHGVYTLRSREVEEFLRLEHPREHAGWILKRSAKSPPKTPSD